MDRAEASALADLKMHWGVVYAIGYQDGTWSGYYRGTPDEFRADYQRRQREQITLSSLH
jgi:hypothetical protein